MSEHHHDYLSSAWRHLPHGSKGRGSLKGNQQFFSELKGEIRVGATEVAGICNRLGFCIGVPLYYSAVDVQVRIPRKEYQRKNNYLELWAEKLAKFAQVDFHVPSSQMVKSC